MLRLREVASVSKVVLGGRMGRYSNPASVTARLEREVAEYLSADHALAVNSGTSALLAALVGVGIGPGDEVLVPAYTWVSTAAAPLLLGAVPVLVDVDETLTMDVADLERKITSRTRAIVPVHMLNLVADMDAVMAVAQRHGLKVVEDACQAFGVLYRGRRVGTIGHAGAFSFSHTKNISAGEGGMLVTSDAHVAARAQMFHDVGSYTRASWTPTSEPLFIGMNLKMSELPAAVLRPQLKTLERRLSRMRAHRAAMVAEFAQDESIRVSPHHDPENATGLTVVFDNAARAERFATARGVTRLIDTERHVFTNWESVRGKRTYDPRFDPYAGRTAPRDPVSPDRSPRTLDVLRRTCKISVRDDYPTPVIRVAARQMVRTLQSMPQRPADVAPEPRLAESVRS
ncbi:DegT/DnrJ/EryC1/StrS family aminotransferase [uncultured Amnibacterium sp.]|uniref:DegT/DnrJ/EryC1/StrS family aminotransferase n=1 Tax=uncultured Amnibacterium sp. TaxID=1631851 RepID=UPI0035CA87E8